MPYRRKRRYKKRKRSRSRFSKKRRRSSRGRSSFGFRVSKQVSRQMAGTRRYFNEFRGSAIATQVNHVRYKSVCAVGAREKIEEIIKSVDAGAIHTGIGETSLGDYETTLEHYKADITNYKKVIHFRNLDEHPNFLTLYECQVKKSFALQNGVDSCADIIDKLGRGWKDYLATGSETIPVSAPGPTQATGKEIIVNENDQEVDVYSQFLMPNKSKQFNEKYKIVRSKKYRLNPGDEVFWTMKVRNRVWNPSKIYNSHNEATDTIDMIGGYTKILLARLSGCLGRSAVADAEGVVGLMETDVAFDIVDTCNIAPMQFAKHEDYGKIDLDDMTGVSLVGPGEHTLIDDDN